MYSSTTSGVAIMLENLSLAPCGQKSRTRQSTLVRRLLKKMRPCKKDFWRETERRSVMAAFIRSIERRQFAIGIWNIAAVAYIIVHGRLGSRLPSGPSRAGPHILLVQTMTERMRVDRLLVERGLFESRAQAQAAIEAGLVVANEMTVGKASLELPADAVLRAEPAHPFVSRGGVKLAAA